MKYELLAIKKISVDGNYALIKIGETNPQYVVAWNLDTERSMENNDLWDAGSYYPADIKGLQGAIEEFRYKTEKDYITRMRLEELATVFKDTMIENCYIEEIDETLKERDLNEYELEFFDLKDYIIDTE